MVTPPRRAVPFAARDVLLALAAAAVDLVVWNGDSELAGGGSLPLWVVPALTVVPAGALLFRRTRPAAVFGLEAVWSLASFGLPRYFPFACLLVALYALASRARPRTAGLALLASAAPLGLFSFRSGRVSGGYDGQRMIESAGIWTLIAVSVWGLGRLLYAREQQARAERARLTLEAEQALQAERLRLARELHDSVSGTMSGIILQAAGARGLSAGADDRVRDALQVIQDAGQQAMVELHRMLGLLRTPEPDDGRPRFAAVGGLVERAQAAGLTVEVRTLGDPRPLDPEADLAAYRIVQESLTNAARHAGTGAAVRLDVGWDAGGLRLEIHSTGGAGPAAGVARLSSGHGLRGLRERARLAGGTLDAGPAAGGWTVRAELPAASTPARADTAAGTDPDAVPR